MAVNPMQRKSRNSFLLGFFIALIIGGIPIGILVFNMFETQKKEEEQENAKTEVWVLNADVSSGDQLDSSKFQKVVIDTTAAPASGKLEPGVAGGTYAKIDLPKGTILTANMVYEEAALTKDVRLQQYNMLLLHKGLEIGDYIDIRFTIPSGEDYIVVARKEIKDVSETTIWIEMTESEILTMNCAIYDNYAVKGSALYTTVYVEPGMQGTEDEVAITYRISNETARLINENPNVVTQAKVGLDQARAAIDSVKGAYDQNEVQSNIEAGVAERIQKTQEERKEYWDELNGGGY